MSNECVNQILPPLYLKKKKGKYLAPERLGNVCSKIFLNSAQSFGVHGWKDKVGYSGISEGRGAGWKGEMLLSIYPIWNLIINSKPLFFSSPCFCPQPVPDLVHSLSEGEPVSRQVKHTLDSAVLSALNHCACSFPLTLVGPNASTDPTDGLFCTRRIPANSSKLWRFTFLLKSIRCQHIYQKIDSKKYCIRLLVC